MPKIQSQTAIFDRLTTKMTSVKLQQYTLFSFRIS